MAGTMSELVAAIDITVMKPNQLRSPWQESAGSDIPPGTLNAILKQAGLR